MSSSEHRLLATDRRIRAMFADEVIADTPTGWLGFGGYKAPLYELGTWWFPRQHVRTGVLVASDHRTVCDVRGPATYWDVVVGDRRAPNLAYAYEQAPAGWEALRELMTFAWNDVEHWYEEEQEVFVHPRGPMHRVDALRSSRHVQVSLDGVVLADTQRPVAVFETGMPPRWYIPRADVALEHLLPSPTRTQCPYKGVAEYYSVRIDSQQLDDLAWTYTFPVIECRRLAQHVCFFSERVDITLDGTRQSRPVTKWQHEIPTRDVL